MDGWSYDRIECTAEQLPGVMDGFGPEWVGVSVTMPGKFAALRFADTTTSRATLVGSANTLVRSPTGWHADNTDIDGVVGALAGSRVSDRAMVVGSGGTAPAVVVGLVELGAKHIAVAARNAEKAATLVELAIRCGARSHWCDIADADLADEVAGVDVVVNTVPAAAVTPYAPMLSRTPVLLDAIYDPWPTPLASAVQTAGGKVISGLHMLLSQAFTQVEQFTGLPAPREAMRAALGVAR
ncbi:shikimate dehydrogenase [Mycolicibacterium cyprinidarum]|uniref:shikimate dehydrogenase (NADP(+)) n=1 Tax=Mycolicibacterium cyprinidarum TaxID=2860311 RepID=A0ABQ4V376_9MYCO|nr:shikimate dehydrogenase [Mycolicibacterium sp. NGTWS0302]GJF08933.1 shikimate dehydrogenase [Mycolicibacterium sp. NGTWSNA01]GJF09864.1 shikimate dehydrogenase [Mycolicibacterium sp. NGTWS1803]